MAERGGYPGTLEANLLAFARILRGDGFLLGVFEVELAARALAGLELAECEEVRLALRSLFAKSPWELRRFDRRFAEYWLNEAENAPSQQPLPPQLQPRLRRLNPSLESWDEQAEGDERLNLMSYSPGEVRAHGPASQRSDEVAALKRLLRKLSGRLATSPSRRFMPSSRRAEMTDLRRTIRHSLSHGGEPLELRYRRRALGKTRLVFAFDVSGSMLLYSTFLLQLAYAFVQTPELGKAEVFGFATDLYHLTPHLRRRGVAAAIAAAARAMPGRSGGTRIGLALDKLLKRYGPFLDRRTVLILHSDGWDTGDLGLLQSAMRRLHERCRRVIWLNPLAASSGYLPLASGMQTAWPYIDTFGAAYDLASLQALAERLPRTAR